MDRRTPAREAPPVPAPAPPAPRPATAVPPPGDPPGPPDPRPPLPDPPRPLPAPAGPARNDIPVRGVSGADPLLPSPPAPGGEGSLTTRSDSGTGPTPCAGWGPAPPAAGAKTSTTSRGAATGDAPVASDGASTGGAAGAWAGVFGMGRGNASDREGRGFSRAGAMDAGAARSSTRRTRSLDSSASGRGTPRTTTPRSRRPWRQTDATAHQPIHAPRGGQALREAPRAPMPVSP